jgi:hypothetical protein
MVVQLSFDTHIQSQLTDAVERDEVTDALPSICREEKWGRSHVERIREHRRPQLDA